MKLIALIIIGVIIVFLPLLLIIKAVISISKEDTEFPSVGPFVSPHEGWFMNLDIFKRIVYTLAEKDEEIKNYLRSRKSRHDARNSDIHDCGGSGASDGEDIPSDI